MTQRTYWLIFAIIAVFMCFAYWLTDEWDYLSFYIPGAVLAAFLAAYTFQYPDSSLGVGVLTVAFAAIVCLLIWGGWELLDNGARGTGATVISSLPRS